MMSFNEKSALAMGVLSLAVLGWFASMIVPPLVAGAGAPAPSELPLITMSIAFIIVSIVAHTVLGIMAPKDAAAGQDERDKAVIHKAGSRAGAVLGFFVIFALLAYVTTGNADVMFGLCLIGMMAATAGNYLLQVAFYRLAH